MQFGCCAACVSCTCTTWKLRRRWSRRSALLQRTRPHNYRCLPLRRTIRASAVLSSNWFNYLDGSSAAPTSSHFAVYSCLSGCNARLFPIFTCSTLCQRGISYGRDCVCLSVCLSVTSRSSIKTAERIELVFGTKATLDLFYNVLEDNSGIFKNKGISLWNLFPNSEFWTLKISQQHVDRRKCCQLGWTFSLTRSLAIVERSARRSVSFVSPKLLMTPRLPLPAHRRGGGPPWRTDTNIWQ